MKIKFFHSENKNEIYGSEHFEFEKEMSIVPPVGSLIWTGNAEAFRVVDICFCEDSDIIDVMMVLKED
jgi:hypothetical protein